MFNFLLLKLIDKIAGISLLAKKNALAFSQQLTCPRNIDIYSIPTVSRELLYTFFASACYPLSIKCPLSTLNTRCFYFLRVRICRLYIKDHAPLLGHVICLHGNSCIHVLGEPRVTEVTFATWVYNNMATQMQ